MKSDIAGWTTRNGGQGRLGLGIIQGRREGYDDAIDALVLATSAGQASFVCQGLLGSLRLQGGKIIRAALPGRIKLYLMALLCPACRRGLGFPPMGQPSGLHMVQLQPPWQQTH
jgi:hypothetical protein